MQSLVIHCSLDGLIGGNKRSLCNQFLRSCRFPSRSSKTSISQCPAALELPPAALVIKNHHQTPWMQVGSSDRINNEDSEAPDPLEKPTSSPTFKHLEALCTNIWNLCWPHLPQKFQSFQDLSTWLWGLKHFKTSKSTWPSWVLRPTGKPWDSWDVGRCRLPGAPGHEAHWPPGWAPGKQLAKEKA